MAAGSTYTPIATTTLSSTASSVTFSSISGAYTDLILVANLKKASGVISNLALTINSDTGSNYSYTRLIGDGTTASSARASSVTDCNGGYITTNWATTIINFMNYSNTTTYKTSLVRTNNDRVAAVVNLWRSTAAITTIKLEEVVTGDIVTGSTFTLYGISCA
jgi:hypothetical protein